MLKWVFLFILSVSLAFAEDTRVGDGTALVIIDMQEIFITRGGHATDPENVRKVNQMMEEQLQLIQMARRQNIPIVFIEYEGEGETNSRLRQAVNGYRNVHTFLKSSDGMFESYNTHLAELSGYLRENRIGRLIITGANGGACVEMSISGAIQNNYDVLAYSRAIADFNYDEFVYPYDDQYARYAGPHFREYDDAPTIGLVMAGQTPPMPVGNVNDSDRCPDCEKTTVPSSQRNSRVSASTTTRQ